MILPVLLALPVALGLLLRGAEGPWAQLIVHIGSMGALTLWLLSRTAVGYIPRPSHRNLLWAVSLTALSALSVAYNPMGVRTYPEWLNFLNALWIFPVMAFVSKDERRYIDSAIRAAAWILMILAFYQKFRMGDSQPASALASPEIYAGAVLMLLPLSLEARDWLLAAGLTATLLWTQSLGAWFGFSCGLFVSQLWRKSAWSTAGLIGLLVCLVVFYGNIQSPGFLNRVNLWGAAMTAIFNNPLLGSGPGSFAVLSKGTQYPSNYILRTASEYGVPFAVLWFGGLWTCMRRGNVYKRFGAVAVLSQSLWDWSLSMPANLWLFSYFVSSSLSEEPRGVNVPSRHKPVVGALILAVGGLLCLQTWHVLGRPA